MAANARVELTPTESKSVVLPLHQFAKCGRGRNRLPLPKLKKGSKPMTSDLHSKHNKSGGQSLTHRTNYLRIRIEMLSG